MVWQSCGGEGILIEAVQFWGINLFHKSYYKALWFTLEDLLLQGLTVRNSSKIWGWGVEQIFAHSSLVTIYSEKGLDPSWISTICQRKCIVTKAQEILLAVGAFQTSSVDGMLRSFIFKVGIFRRTVLSIQILEQTWKDESIWGLVCLTF